MLFIVTALLAEAKPLIEHFNLKKIFNDTPFPIFRKENIYLIVSGIGKNSVAMAISYLSGFVSKPALYLNIGIAGHKSLEVGTLTIASKFIDDATKDFFYPTFLNRFSIPYEPLITVESPETQFEKEALYDMEGSAFFKAASHFTSSEFICSLKIVSDTSKQTFYKKTVPQLIEKNLFEIEKIVSILQKTAEKTPTPPEMTSLLESCHFSETQRQQLKKALQKLQLKSSDEILTFLENHVSSSLY